MLRDSAIVCKSRKDGLGTMEMSVEIPQGLFFMVHGRRSYKSHIMVVSVTGACFLPDSTPVTVTGWPARSAFPFRYLWRNADGPVMLWIYVFPINPRQ